MLRGGASKRGRQAKQERETRWRQTGLWGPGLSHPRGRLCPWFLGRWLLLRCRGCSWRSPMHPRPRSALMRWPLCPPACVTEPPSMCVRAHACVYRVLEESHEHHPSGGVALMGWRSSDSWQSSKSQRTEEASAIKRLASPSLTHTHVPHSRWKMKGDAPRVSRTASSSSVCTCVYVCVSRTPSSTSVCTGACRGNETLVLAAPTRHHTHVLPPLSDSMHTRNHLRRQ